MFSHRLLLSLVVVLLLSTLALADVANNTAEFMHSGVTTHHRPGAYLGYFSTNGGKPTSTVLDAYSSRVSTSDARNAGIGAGLAGQPTYGQHITDYKLGFAPSVSGMHRTRFEKDNWTSTGQKPGLSTPEPGSLMLLSTGLMGIAGMVRRKLRLG